MKLDIQKFADGQVIIEADLVTKSFDRQIAQLEYELDELQETYKLALKDPDWDKKDLMDMEAEMQKLSNKLVDLRQKQSELNSTQMMGASTFKSSLKSLTKMGLAIFGIRSAYMLIRQSANQLAQDNDVMASKLQAIKGALTNAIAPVAEYLVNLIYKLLSYLNVITKTFLGIDLFKKTAKSAKSAVGSAQKLRKTLAGFDEMNILNDNTTASGGGGGGTIEPPKVDTTQWEEKVKEVKKAYDDILQVSLKEAYDTFIKGDNSIWGYAKLGMFWISQGVTKLVDGIINIFKVDFKTGFKEALEGLGTLLIGIFTPIWGFFVTSTKSVIKIMSDLFTTMLDFITSPIREGVNIAVSLFKSFANTIKSIIDGVKKIFTGDLKGALTSFKSAFTSTMNALWTIAKAPLNLIISGINALIRGLNKISISVPSWIPSIGGKKWGFNINQIPRLAKGGIINMPSNGVPIGIGGESGAEGVIPLTDSQQMELLGEAIGRYITINANITNTMNGRIISRELQKIQNETSFASNR